MILKTEIWRSFYQDSVILMRVAASVRTRPGIVEAAAFMGTPANHALLDEAGLATAESRDAAANDMILTIKGDDDEAVAAGFAAAKELLSARRGGDDEAAEALPRTLDSALRQLPDANLVAISVPGAYAKFEAMRALRRDMSVFMFSDNVPVEDEIELKQEALRRGLLCMGPDCGTAYLNGVGLGFFNVVSRGRIGCVAASGTGLQAVVSRIAALGEGISQGVGVGGRDLSSQVGGAMTLFTLEALARDPQTEAVVLISKPPAADVMAKLEKMFGDMGKPVVVICLGAEPRPDSAAVWARTLDEAAEAAVALVNGKTWTASTFDDAASVRTRLDALTADGGLGSILGLYTGGTLAHEAHLLLEPLLGPVDSNLGHGAPDSAHRILDLGDDAYTVGRPHPMIEPETRSEVLRKDGAAAGVLLFDLVLGKGSHADPAQPLAAEFKRICAAAKGRRVVGVASVVGTDLDPQDLDGQIAQLKEAGIQVFPSNAQAVRFAALLARPDLATSLLENAQ